MPNTSHSSLSARCYSKSCSFAAVTAWTLASGTAADWTRLVLRRHNSLCAFSLSFKANFDLVVYVHSHTIGSDGMLHVKQNVHVARAKF